MKPNVTVNKRSGDAPAAKTTLRLRLITCGELAGELLAIINQLPPDVAELICLLAAWYNHLEKIFRDIKAKVKVPEKLVSPLC